MADRITTEWLLRLQQTMRDVLMCARAQQPPSPAAVNAELRVIERILAERMRDVR